MEVRALEMGFFDGRRIRPGQTFEVPEGTKARWFKPVGEPVKGAEKAAEKAAAKGKGKKAEPATLSELGTEGAQTFQDVVGKADDLA